VFDLEHRNSYDHGGRITQVEQHIYEHNAWYPVSTFEYDALGRSITQKLGVDGEKIVQEVNNTFNIRGWLTSINNPDNLGTDLFAMRLNYQNQTLPEERQYTGNITETDWAYRDGNPGDVKRMAYRYTYDGLNRLTDGRWYNGGVRESDKFDTRYEYDLQGNIKNLSRYGISGTTNALIDNLGYTYDGNRLQGVVDNSGKEEGYRDINKTNDFLYTANGSMKKDLDKGIDVTYNLLNLPQVVKETSGNLSVNYVYTATGAKLATLYLNGSNLVGGNRYMGPIVRRYDSNTSAWVNDYVPTAEGRVVYKGGTTWVPQYFLKDHLGNTRSIVEKSTSYSSTTGWATQVWQQSYYPFGMTLGQTYMAENNQLTYNGKERQDFALNSRALDWLDYGARMYDASLGRWHRIDGKAEKYLSNSPYHFSGNNPVKFVEINGDFFIIATTTFGQHEVRAIRTDPSVLKIMNAPGYIPFMPVIYDITTMVFKNKIASSDPYYKVPLSDKVGLGVSLVTGGVGKLFQSFATTYLGDALIAGHHEAGDFFFNQAYSSGSDNELQLDQMAFYALNKMGYGKTNRLSGDLIFNNEILGGYASRSGFNETTVADKMVSFLRSGIKTFADNNYMIDGEYDISSIFQQMNFNSDLMNSWQTDLDSYLNGLYNTSNYGGGY
jgi:RHS repeat-associated protein